ncbi:MAG: SOS response-associated peptidase [Myxococcota bacterium]
MCGRYGVRVNFKTLAKLLRAEPVTPEETGDEWGPDLNVAPTDPAPVLLPPLADGEPPRLELFRWGLVPFWAKSPREGARMINARAETLGSKPAFREALAERRLLVPASGWYEWTPAAPDSPDPKPDPHWIHPGEHGQDPGPEQLVLFGGLWARWKDPQSGETRRTFSIVTTAAAESTRVLHDRMPLVLGPEAQAAWLDARTPPDVIQGLLVPFPGRIAHRRVAKTVNSVRADGPELIEPLPEPRQAKLL